MPNCSKTLMILGAGPLQTPGIRKAVGLGYFVISVDDRPESVGHKFSHQYLKCSTVELETLALEAEKLGIDGICTFSSDVAVPSVGYVCDRLSLPGVSLAVAQSMSTKHRFREAQKRAGLPHPAFLIARSPDCLESLERELHFPVVFKPVDSSGSRGVRLLDHASPDDVASAFAFAQSFSASGTVCVEEFVGDCEVGGDGILFDGKLAFLAITEKHLDGFVVTGHSLPSTLAREDQDRVRKALEECCRAVGYARGPLNFDVKVGPERVVVLEMSARNGGNGIPAVIMRATRVDVEEATIRLALGEAWRLPEVNGQLRGAASLVFGSRSGGTLVNAGSFAQVQQKVPELVELNLAVPLGNPVKPFEHNGNLIGYAVFDCEPPATYAEVAARITEALDLRVEATQPA
jgi:carbamoylphosphate synthase large subunit